MADLFKDIIPSILQTGKKVITAENEKDYVPYVVNRGLSFHYDCILYVNEMNRLPNTDGLLQYHYLLHSIRKYKRPFQKWQKRVDDDNLDLVKEYYGYSNEKAKDALKLLTKDQLKTIKGKLDKGGTKKR